MIQKVNSSHFKKGNIPWNKNLTKEISRGLRRISKKLKCEGNGMWKGDNVGFRSLHEWIKSHKSKPKFCEECRKKKRLDLANISQEYYRDINDFKWLCRRCHMKEDGRLNNFKKYIGRNKSSNHS